MTHEKPVRALSGWPLLLADLALFVASIWWFVDSVRSIKAGTGGGLFLGLSIGLFVAAILGCVGFFVVQPNEARVLVLFGVYKGSVRDNGFYWANPFLQLHRVSLRARNLEGAKLKVNDRAGNPIEIAVVVVWRVANTVQALFDVDDYRTYVTTQSEAAVRQLAGRYPYDSYVETHEETPDENHLSLREGREQINHMLERELAERLTRAGVEVIEARLTHLAYAPEIAGAMLQRQQAEAIVAARTKIVDGAVGMVEMALARLSQENIIVLDEERKAAMVSNLLVVLCGDRAAQPVVNTGTLYT